MKEKIPSDKDLSVRPFLETSDLKSEKDHIEQLRSEISFNSYIDDLLEQSLKLRRSLKETLSEALPLLATAVNAKNICIRTFDESLTLTNFYFSTEKIAVEIPDDHRGAFLEVGEEIDGEPIPRTYIGRSLDVAGEWFGSVIVEFTDHILAEFDGENQKRITRLISVWCEELDNYLAGIVQSRVKQKVANDLATALMARVLEDGVSEAVKILSENMSFDDFVLLYWDHAHKSPIKYQVVLGKDKFFDSEKNKHEKLEILLNASDQKDFKNLSREIPDIFETENFFEQEVIFGQAEKQVERQVVGRIAIGRKRGTFNIFDRDLLQIFSTHLRQRVVDFNREWIELTNSFSPDATSRLLKDEDYQSKYLSVQTNKVAVLHAGIFNILSRPNQLLENSSEAEELIYKWCSRVSDIIWKNNGVLNNFDGETISAIWGPPFFDIKSDEFCLQAIKAAKEIQSLSKTLFSKLELTSFEASKIQSAISIHFSNITTGLFGPNQNYSSVGPGLIENRRLCESINESEIRVTESFYKELKEPPAASTEKNKKFDSIGDVKFRVLK